MEKFKMSAVALLLCVLFLSGCVVSAPVQESTHAGQGEQATPPAGSGRLYRLRMGDLNDPQAVYTILDEDGQVVLQGKNLSIIYDTATGMPQCILAERYETGRRRFLFGGESRKTYVAMYDTVGSLLEDWQELKYSSGLGPYVLRMDDRKNILGNEIGEGCLYNIYTKERIYEGIRYLDDMGDGQ